MSSSGTEQFTNSNFLMDRKAPTPASRGIIRYEDDPVARINEFRAPLELRVEATNDEGELAAWFIDEWWLMLIGRLVEERTTIVLAPTSGSLLHSGVLHQMEMLRRVAPNWRLTAYAYPSDVKSLDDIELLARSPYHEVRFHDQTRPGVENSGRMTAGLPLEELLGSIRREQARINATRPILARIPAHATEHGQSVRNDALSLPDNSDRVHTG